MTVPSGSSKVVLIVGGSSGIGRACAHQFTEQGAKLVLAARSERRLKEVELEARERGAVDILVVPTDVLDQAAISRLVAEAMEAFGRIDVVVFSAGVMAYGAVEDVPADVFQRTVDTALHGTANVARAVLPVFRAQQSGTLIVVTSLLASVAVPQMGAYIAGKWGQLAVARILQLETRTDQDINVCTVAPGAVDTSIYRTAANFAGRVGRPPPPVSAPERLARAIVSCADRPRKNMSVGATNRIVTLGFRLLPAIYDRLVTPLFEFAALSPQRVEATDGNVFDPDRPLSNPTKMGQAPGSGT